MSAEANVDDFLRGLDRLGVQIVAEAERAVGQFAWHVVGDSQQLTPVATGFLQNSASVGDVDRSGGVVRVEFGHNASYAAAVHERLDAHHPIGQAKYLEAAMRKNVDAFGRFVARRLRAAGGGG